jgi:tRNA (guanosine-2'-O-)-methyltransferase
VTPGSEVPGDRLPDEVLARIIEVLAGHLRPERLERIRGVVASRSRAVVLVLEEVANEHNASAVLRTAEAFGFFEVHTVEATSAITLSKRITMGAHKWLDLRRHADHSTAYAELKRRGYEIWASDIHGRSRDVHEIPIEGDRKVALVFGNEHAGLSQVAAEAADGRFKIPMTGFVESFNVSVAVALSTYDLWLRRRALGLASGLSPHEQQAILAAFLARSVAASRAVLERAGLPVPIVSGDVIEPVL